jgi:hypothetical protein
VELTEGGEEAAVTAQNMARGDDGLATGADERSREGEGALWCTSKGEWGRDVKGMRWCQQTPFKRRGGRQGKEGVSEVGARVEEGEGWKGGGGVRRSGGRHRPVAAGGERRRAEQGRAGSLTRGPGATVTGGAVKTV